MGGVFFSPEALAPFWSKFRRRPLTRNASPTAIRRIFSSCSAHSSRNGRSGLCGTVMAPHATNGSRLSLLARFRPRRVPAFESVLGGTPAALPARRRGRVSQSVKIRPWNFATLNVTDNLLGQSGLVSSYFGGVEIGSSLALFLNDDCCALRNEWPWVSEVGPTGAPIAS